MPRVVCTIWTEVIKHNNSIGKYFSGTYSTESPAHNARVARRHEWLALASIRSPATNNSVQKTSNTKMFFYITEIKYLLYIFFFFFFTVVVTMYSVCAFAALAPGPPGYTHRPTKPTNSRHVFCLSVGTFCSTRSLYIFFFFFSHLFSLLPVPLSYPTLGLPSRPAQPVYAKCALRDIPR